MPIVIGILQLPVLSTVRKKLTLKKYPTSIGRNREEREMSHSIFTDNQDEWICWLTVPNEAELDEDLRRLFSKAREKLGFVPNVFITFTV
jgi:hypothetical protein